MIAHMDHENNNTENGNAWPVWSKYVLKSIEKIVSDIDIISVKLSAMQDNFTKLASVVELTYKNYDFEKLQDKIHFLETKVIVLENEKKTRDKKSVVLSTSSAAIVMALIEIIKNLVDKV